MGDFQLISLADVARPVREERELGEFSLIQFPGPDMAAATPFSLPTDRDITPADLVGWKTPMEAAAYAAICVGTDGAFKAVWQLLKGGMIEAVATSWSRTPKGRGPIASSKPTRISGRMWNDFSDSGSDLWNGGYARFWVSRGDDIGSAYHYYGIKLNPDDVKANLPPVRDDLLAKARAKEVAPSATAATPDRAPESPPANKGGRPRKEWWDDFWIEICRRIWMGDLQPKTQADLEKAMFEWVENHKNAEVGETTIKAAAKKLFKAWGLGSKT